MTDTKPLKQNKAGAGRKPCKKRTSWYAKIFFTESDYNKLDAVKQATGRSLQDIGNTAINEFVQKFGGNNG
jgi:hypothetical protein